jgi:hypothetical protein
MEVKMGEYQAQNGLEITCHKCNTVYNTKDGNCPTCEPNFRDKKIYEGCLKKVFKLDKALYDK